MRGGRTLLLFVALFFLFLSISAYVTSNRSKLKDASISDIASLTKAGKVDSIQNTDNELLVQLKDGSALHSTIEPNANLADYGITPDKVNISAKISRENPYLSIFFNSLLPVLLIGGILWWSFRQAQGSNNRAMSFGSTRAKPLENVGSVTFDSVAGLVEAKQELQEVVEFLKNPEKFQKLGGEIPKGVLLVGPPGTGKTLLAKAVAGEAGAPFFSISASEFVEMFVGVGASRVRDLFMKAKRHSPAIIFIDELDAIGRQRGTGLGGGHDEREQTLNQILVEMDGFETQENVIVVAATNRPDVLDPALLRPGRFDRQVQVDLPDRRDRIAILKVHTKNKPLAEGIDLESIARQTAGFSGADLRNVANEAAIFAARKDQKEITQHDFNQAVEKEMMGPERRSRVLSQKEKEITAYHEVGHALVGRVLPNNDPLHKVTIVSRGRALGFTWSLPTEDIHLYDRSRFLDQLAQMLGGRAAEEIVYGEITTGAEDDLRRATKLARRMVTEFGMSDKLGPIAYGEREDTVFLGRDFSSQPNYSDKIAEEIDSEVRRIMTGAYHRAKMVVSEYRDLLNRITTDLLREETLEGPALEAYFEGMTFKPVSAPAN